MSPDAVDREIADHCRAFQALKGVGRQRGCDGCEAGEAECWGHYCAIVLAPKHGIRPHWNPRLWEREQRVHNDRAQQLWGPVVDCLIHLRRAAKIMEVVD